jgi:glycosyltransferase involved in cell wall biosynthesis
VSSKREDTKNLKRTRGVKHATASAEQTGPVAPAAEARASALVEYGADSGPTNEFDNKIFSALASRSAARAIDSVHENGKDGLGSNGQSATALSGLTGAADTLRGSVDRASWASVEGWVWDPKRPKERIQVEVLEGDTPLATAIANIVRPDLIPASIGDGRHGFHIALRPGLLSQGPHTLHLRCADSGLPVPGSPVVVQPASSDRGAPPRWHVDQFSDRAVTGWIAPNGGAARHCTVALKEGGRLLVRAIASQFRSDLLSAGIGDGCYAFELRMPGHLLDGREHLLEVIEEDTGLTLTDEPILWRATAGTAGPALTGIGIQGPAGESPVWQPQIDAPPFKPGVEDSVFPPLAVAGKRTRATVKSDQVEAGSAVRTHLLFDVSDLVYYIGEHANLTGIQRVQSSIALAMIEGDVVDAASVVFLSFNARTRNWLAIPTGFLISLLRDLLLPVEERLINFPAQEAKLGILPGAHPFDGTGVLDDGKPSVLCLLGAAWVHQDYIHRVLALKRRFATRFVMTVHDLIPIYARDTCDADTVRVFEEFMRRALRHVDHVLAVSNNTAKDLRRYLATLQIPAPPITVSRNGSSFGELMPASRRPAAMTSLEIPERFVLFVATIEGRKNHQLIYDIWRRMLEQGDDPPHLICVGRLGWKATAFVSGLVETNYLNGRVHLLREISDTDLLLLYNRCLFTLCPTLYEGWGLPVSEALTLGKICVCSDRASIPEVAGDCGVYINIDDADASTEVIRNLISDDHARAKLEAKIRRSYVPITWRSVAERVVSACDAAVATPWQEPYPYVALPYSVEVSFGQLDLNTDGTGELVLSRTVDARLGHYKFEALNQQSFLLGETIRSGGNWAQPERWGTWLCNSRGEIAFVLAAEDSPAVWAWLRMRVCGVLHEQPIRLLANGERLWSGRIGPHSQDIVLRIRKRPGVSSRCRIVVEVDVSTEHRNQIAALDSRLPTVGLERLIVVPENDVTMRLDVLSKMFLARQ